ncbi:MAG TPA: hypothetical protein QGI27_00455, partial [Flavobacteriaceae bacterium]|nr:hypothetical protein [Flavobacteriaceae bacterium]
THITVAHSMGTTIGINTSILFASLLFIVSKLSLKNQLNRILVKRSLVLYNVSLLFFWVSLLIAGAKRSHWMYFTKDIPFSLMQDSLYYVYIAFFTFSIVLVASILMITIPILKILLLAIKLNRSK